MQLIVDNLGVRLIEEEVDPQAGSNFRFLSN